jgi:hypothetical protein
VAISAVRHAVPQQESVPLTRSDKRAANSIEHAKTVATVAQKEAVAAIQKQQAEEKQADRIKKNNKRAANRIVASAKRYPRGAVSEEEASLSSRNSKIKNSQVQSEADT